MTDAPFLALLYEIFEYAPAGIHIVGDAVLADIVIEIEVEIVNSAPAKLALENSGGVEHVVMLVSRELVGKMPLFAGVAGQSRTQHLLGISVVVGESSIEIIDSLSDGLIDHCEDSVAVNAPVRKRRQPHRTEAERGQPCVLDRIVEHTRKDT